MRPSAGLVPDAEGPVRADVADRHRSPFLTQSVRGGAEPPVVAAGDHHITGGGGVPVGQLRFLAVAGALRRLGDGGVVGESLVAGAAVEVGDDRTGGGDHQRVEPGCPVGVPGVEGVVGDGGEVADMDPSVVEVEAERGGLTVA